MSLKQKIVILVLSLTILWLGIEVSQGSEDLECNDVLTQCIKSVESKTEIIAKQDAIIAQQAEVVKNQEVVIERGETANTVWSVVGSIALFICVIL
jgi:hypothetical protein